MKKVISLILIALVVAGVVIGLVKWSGDMDGKKTEVPEFTSQEANEWKEKIDSLCMSGKWTEQGYKQIETGIHTDRVTSQGELISRDEENALNKYLFTSSCHFLNEELNKLFKGKSYSDTKIKASENMLSFLKSVSSNYSENSNLKEATEILSQYHQLISMLSFSSSATYSTPLKPFKGVSAETAKSRIKGMKYYSSLFSNNPEIKSKVDNLSSNRARAEAEYYMNLERAIQNQYKKTHDLTRLLDDQIDFNKISTNENAKNQLSSFVNNPNR